MTKKSLTPAVLAEFVGTGVILFALSGAGVQILALTGNPGLTLLAVAAASAVSIALVIVVLGPFSGGHFNPAVTLALALAGKVNLTIVAPYVIAQTAGAIAGIITTNLLWSDYAIATTVGLPSTPQQIGSEFVATLGLLGIIMFLIRTGRTTAIPFAAATWIGLAILMTPTGSVANPAATIARMFTDGFTAVGTQTAPSYVGAQIIAALAATIIAWLADRARARTR